MFKTKKIIGGYGIIQTEVLKLKIHPYSKLIYAYLASLTGSKEFCWPSIETISRDLGISMRTVTKCLRELENNNLIKKSKYKKTQAGRKNKYEVFFLEKISFESALDADSNESKVHQVPVESACEGVYNNNNINNNNIINNSNKLLIENKIFKDDVIKLVNHWNNKTGEKYVVKNDKEFRQINAIIKREGLKEIMMAISESVDRGYKSLFWGVLKNHDRITHWAREYKKARAQ